MTEYKTIRELLDAGLVSESQVEAAIDAALNAAAFNLGAGTLDLISAVAANPAALGYLADPRKGESFRRDVVRGQIMSARPLREKPKLV